MTLPEPYYHDGRAGIPVYECILRVSGTQEVEK